MPTTGVAFKSHQIHFSSKITESVQGYFPSIRVVLGTGGISALLVKKMARISPNNIRFRTKDIICRDLAHVLNEPKLHIGTKLAVVDQIFWVWTEFGGKYRGCEFWSQKAIESGRTCEGLIHEHIVPRKIVRNRLLELNMPTPEAIRLLLDQILIGVVVTKEEDEKLNSLGLRSKMPHDWDGSDPWARHKAAKITTVQQKRKKRNKA